MREGEIIGERFQIHEVAGRGGMATVYRAKDCVRGEWVALKLLRPGESRERFIREATLLSSLAHPAIVRYLSHGMTQRGEAYLAMEWLEGETLAGRLSRKPMAVQETIDLGIRVAGALSEAHSHGVIHRDLKPSNLLLPGGEIRLTTLLDFGIAWAGARSGPAESAEVMGTPSYMAPEQARGDETLDGRADLFALGCILFECLSERPAFRGEHTQALLAKVLFEEPPHLLELLPELSPALADLVFRLLSKQASDRLETARQVVEELSHLQKSERLQAGSARSARLTAREQRAACVLLAKGTAEAPLQRGLTTLAAGQAEEDASFSVAALAQTFDARLEWLADGSLVLMMSDRGTARDQAAGAARIALALRRLAPHSSFSIATGQAEVSSRFRVGPLLERAASALSHSGERCICIDEVTAGLLLSDFDIAGDASSQRVLSGERGFGEQARTLLGKKISFQGRESELGAAMGWWGECQRSSVARAVLFIGDAGIGKSRLLHEMILQIRQECPHAEVWNAGGDSLSSGSPFGLLARVLRRAFQLNESETLEEARRKIVARVARHVPEPSAFGASQFLGELLGVPFDAEPGSHLWAARRDPLLMGDQMSHAWQLFLSSECEHHPVVLSFEDLHWGDLPSARFVGGALAALSKKPFFVLGTARPEISTQFPKLWEEGGVHKIRLEGLGRAASENIVRSALGENCRADWVEKIIQRADGNAFYLEELIRAFSEGRLDELPGTVLAMAHSRIQALPKSSRQVLRAASVFGELFWRDGLASLLAGTSEAAELSSLLSYLVKNEVVSPSPSARFQGQVEYRFRHALLRDTAYATFTSEDCSLAHRLAARWLQGVGEDDATAMARHTELGGEMELAIGWYRKAAEQARHSFDVARTEEAAARGVACGATGEALGVLRLCQSEIFYSRQQISEGSRAISEALELLPQGSTAWCEAAANHILMTLQYGEREAAFVALEQFRQTDPVPEGLLGYAKAIFTLVFVAYSNGLYSVGETFVHRLEDIIAKASHEDMELTNLCAGVRLIRARMHIGDAWLARQYARQITSYFEKIGDERWLVTARYEIITTALMVGDPEEAERQLRLCRASRAEFTNSANDTMLALALAQMGDREGAATHCRAAEAIADRLVDRVSTSWHLGLQTQTWLLLESPIDAERTMTKAMKRCRSPRHEAVLLSYRARALLMLNRTEEAAEAAEAAMRMVEELGGVGAREPCIRLAFVQTLNARGEVARAQAALQDAHKQLLERAGWIPEPLDRQRYLTRVPEHAALMKMGTSPK
jgi:tetratricopeptide (TPR) repeat protein